MKKPAAVDTKHTHIYIYIHIYIHIYIYIYIYCKWFSTFTDIYIYIYIRTILYMLWRWPDVGPTYDKCAETFSSRVFGWLSHVPEMIFFLARNSFNFFVFSRRNKVTGRISGLQIQEYKRFEIALRCWRSCQMKPKTPWRATRSVPNQSLR